MHYLLFLLLSLIWGTNFILMKKAVLGFDPTTVALLRVAGGLAPLLLVWLLRRERWPLGREHVLPLLLVALLGYSWPFAIQPVLIRQADSGFISMVVCFVPLITILVSVPILGILPKPRQVAGVAIGLACSAVILMSGREQHAMNWWTIAMAVSVPLFYAITNTYIKRQFVGVRAMPLTISSLAFSTVILSPVALLSEQTPATASVVAESTVATAAADGERAAGAEPLVSSLLPIVSVIALGVVGTGLGILIFNKLLQEQGPLFAGMVTYLIPLIAILWGAVDGEKVTTVQLLAFAGVLAAVALVQFGGLEKSALARAEGETLR